MGYIKGQDMVVYGVHQGTRYGCVWGTSRDKIWLCMGYIKGQDMVVYGVHQGTRYGCVWGTSRDKIWLCMGYIKGQDMVVYGVHQGTRYGCVWGTSRDQIWLCMGYIKGPDMVVYGVHQGTRYGCVWGTSRDKIYNELWLMSLYDRRNYRRLAFVYKIKMLPNYLKLLIPGEVVPTNYNLRRRHRNNIPTRTNNFQYSFFPHCMNAWGKLSKFLTGSLSFSVFQSRYLQFFRISMNFIYKVHNPVGLKYLTRLRMGLSHLKSHKFLHNFNDTLDRYCVCDNKSIVSVTISRLCL